MPIKFLEKAQRMARVQAIEEILMDFQGIGHDADRRIKAYEICHLFEGWIDEITKQIKGKSNG